MRRGEKVENQKRKISPQRPQRSHREHREKRRNKDWEESVEGYK